MTQKPRLLAHTSRQPIRWGDMDMLGHVKNTEVRVYLGEAGGASVGTFYEILKSGVPGRRTQTRTRR